jgi:hypothetical protein
MPLVPGHVVIPMSNYDATAVYQDPVIQMRWSLHEISCWAASRAIFTQFPLTRAAVFFARQSMHTFAQSPQDTLRASLWLTRRSRIPRGADRPPLILHRPAGSCPPRRLYRPHRLRPRR